MWLTKKLNSEKALSLKSGETSSASVFSIKGESDYKSPESIFPYGVVSRAVSGKQALMLGSVCAGLPMAPDSSLNEGEVRLYSSGGASIILKNDGTVEINGQVFSAAGD